MNNTKTAISTPDYPDGKEIIIKKIIFKILDKNIKPTYFQILYIPKQRKQY